MEAPEQSGPQPACSTAPEQSGPQPGCSTAPEQSGPQPGCSTAPEQSGPQPGCSTAPEQSGPQPTGSTAPEQSAPQPACSTAPEQSGPQPECSTAPEQSGPQPACSTAPEQSDSVAPDDAAANPHLLLEAVLCKDISNVEILLNSGSEVNATFAEGFTALHFAIILGDALIVKLLLDGGAEVNQASPNGDPPLHIAILHDHVSIFNETSAYPMHPLAEACNTSVATIHLPDEQREISITELLLMKGGDVSAVNNDGWTALHMAASKGLAEAVQLLLSFGADIDATTPAGFTALYVAARRLHLAVVHLLLQSGAEINIRNAHGASYLHAAIARRETLVARLLLDLGADFDVAERHGITPLHLALQMNDTAIVERLINVGANIAAVDGNGNTPLHTASENGRTDHVKLLIDFGAEINKKNFDGNAPLNLAVDSGHLTTVEMLLQREADVNMKGQRGCTPLHFALDKDSIINLLLNFGAYIIAQDDNGNTPLHLAAFGSTSAVVELLLMCGADVTLTNNNKFTALHVAALRGNVSIVNLLLNYGANVHSLDTTGCTPLLLAAIKDHPSVIELLLRKGAVLNTTNSNGDTPLHCAVKHNNSRTVQLLLNKGVDVNIANKDNVTPLHLAGNLKEESGAQLLVDSGAKLNVADKDGNTPLHYATKFSNVTFAHLLLQNGANVHTKNKTDYSPLRCAVEQGDTALVNLLLGFGANCNEITRDGLSLLHLAVIWEQRGNKPIVKLLLDNGANANIKGLNDFSPLHVAVFWNLKTIASLLLDSGANVDIVERSGSAPLHVACQRCDPATVEMLLKKGAGPNMTDSNNCTPLHLAARRGNAAIVRLLLDFGADMNMVEKFRHTPLCMAAVAKHIPIVELLLSRGPELNIQNIDYETVVHLMVHRGSTSILSLILEFNANVNLVNKKGNTPLVLASGYGNLPIVTLLLSKGADINIANIDGNSSLHAAIGTGDEIIVKTLLNAGADIHAVNKIGNTPLHHAIYYGRLSIVELLLQNNADINIMNGYGDTPLSLSAQHRNMAIMELLLQYGANAEVNSMNESVKEERTTDEPELLTYDAADPDELFKCKVTPLHSAAWGGDVSIVRKLLDLGANVEAADIFDTTALHYAAIRGHEQIIELLLKAGAQVEAITKHGYTPLHYAILSKNESIIDLLLKSGARIDMVDTKGNTSLHMIFCRKHNHIILEQYIHKNNKYLDKDSDTLLHFALAETIIANSLITMRAEINAINKFGNTPLHLAVQNSNKPAVELLLKNGADPNIADYLGFTPLHFAATEGDAYITELLLNLDTDVNAMTEDGYTPLHLAINNTKPHVDFNVILAVVKLLLNYNADVMTTNKRGDTPLNTAIKLGHTVILDLLLKTGANVHTEDQLRNTPLHVAAFTGIMEAVELLLHHGCGTDVTQKNAFGETPITIAKLYHHHECSEETVHLLQATEMSLTDHVPDMMTNKNPPPPSNSSNILQYHNDIEKASNNLRDISRSEFRYQKTSDTSGICGQLYETKLLCVVHLRALNAESIEHFLIASNMSGVGDMDDICMRYRVRGQHAPVVLFVQAKHREHSERRLTERDLLSASGDFSLSKYFESYLAIKERFRTETEDPMFEGHFDDVECNLVVYTPAKADFARKSTERSPSKMVDNLINTGLNTEPLQYDYDEESLVRLSKIPVIKRLKLLAASFLELIMSKKYKPNNIFTDKKIARYQVVMARRVLQIKQENEDHRVWQFRPDFLKTNCEYLAALRDGFIIEILTKRCDQSDINDADRNNLQRLLENPCAVTISKLIGKLITYNEENMKLRLIEVAAFTKKLKRNDLEQLVEKLDRIVVSESVLLESIELKMLSIEVKLPLMFGNLDMTFRGNEVKVRKRINTVAEKLIYLLDINKDTMIVDINDHTVGPGKPIEQGIIDINGGLGSAVGNLLVLDIETNMLKFQMDSVNLPQKAQLVLNELKDAKYHPINEHLIDYRIKVHIIEFPIDSLIVDVDDYKKQAREFLDNLWLYCDQAKQDKVENIVKNDIDKFYNNEYGSNVIMFKIDPYDIYLEAHNKLQIWWMSNDAHYLSKNYNIFESAKLACINKLLSAAVSCINECGISSIDVKLKKNMETIDGLLCKLCSIFDIKNPSQKDNDIQNILWNKYNEWKNNDTGHTDDHLEIVNNDHQIEVFKRRSGTSGVLGHLYETKLLCLILLRSLNDPQVKDFVLENNIKDIGIMDDVCLRYELKRRRKPIGLFLQAKHREDTGKGKITVEDIRSPSGEFSLNKYFESYILIKDQFQVNSSNRLSEGEFDDIDCHFVIYTPVKSSFNKKKSGNDINDRIHYLIQSKQSTADIFQFDYDEIDVDNLTCTAVKKQLEKLAILLIRVIMSDNINSKSLTNNLIATYYVVIAREVLKKCNNTNQEFCEWKFRPEFFEADSEYLVHFKNTIVKELYSNRYDQSKITDYDLEKLNSFLNRPCAIELNKIISKVVTYNEKTKTLKLVNDSGFRYYDEFDKLTKRLNKTKIEPIIIKEAVEIKLLSMDIKLPAIFHNSDMFYNVNETDIDKTLDVLTNQLINLLELHKDMKTITLNSNILGAGKSVDDVFSIRDCIGSAVGNLLILDTNTKTLRFDVNNKSLPHNAALFLDKIKHHERYHIIEPLDRFQFEIDVKGFPKYSFEPVKYDKRDARDFLNKFWFYTNQAKEDEIENVLKEEINKYYYNKINENYSKYGNELQSSYLSSQAHDYLQKWSMQTIESPYLSRLSDLFERAKLSDIHNILRSVVNYLYIQQIYSVDIRFCQPVNQVDNFKKLGEIFGQMSNCLFRLFDPSFDQMIDLNVAEEAYPNDFREVVFCLEIEPEMQYVKLIMTLSSTASVRCTGGCFLHTTASRTAGRCIIRHNSKKLLEYYIFLNSQNL